MKHLYILVSAIAICCLAACSKKSDPAPVTDPRVGTVVINGYTYPTIIIGTQTWTSFNYLGGTGSLAKPDNTYGNYYTLQQAMQIPLPTGWRIPGVDDYNKMLSTFSAATKNSSGNYVGDISVARALADTAQFHSLASPDLTMKATNSSGFSAYPGGAYNLSNQSFTDQFLGGAFLTTTTGTENGSSVSYFFGIVADGIPVGSSLTGYYAGIDFNYTAYANSAYSLRFVKDN